MEHRYHEPWQGIRMQNFRATCRYCNGVVVTERNPELTGRCICLACGQHYFPIKERKVSVRLGLGILGLCLLLAAFLFSVFSFKIIALIFGFLSVVILSGICVTAPTEDSYLN